MKYNTIEKWQGRSPDVMRLEQQIATEEKARKYVRENKKYIRTHLTFVLVIACVLFPPLIFVLCIMWAFGSFKAISDFEEGRSIEESLSVSNVHIDYDQYEVTTYKGTNSPFYLKNSKGEMQQYDLNTGSFVYYE